MLKCPKSFVVFKSSITERWLSLILSLGFLCSSTYAATPYEISLKNWQHHPKVVEIRKKYKSLSQSKPIKRKEDAHFRVVYEEFLLPKIKPSSAGNVENRKELRLIRITYHWGKLHTEVSEVLYENDVSIFIFKKDDNSIGASDVRIYFDLPSKDDNSVAKPFWWIRHTTIANAQHLEKTITKGDFTDTSTSPFTGITGSDGKFVPSYLSLPDAHHFSSPNSGMTDYETALKKARGATEPLIWRPGVHTSLGLFDVEDMNWIGIFPKGRFEKIKLLYFNGGYSADEFLNPFARLAEATQPEFFIAGASLSPPSHMISVPVKVDCSEFSTTVGENRLHSEQDVVLGSKASKVIGGNGKLTIIDSKKNEKIIECGLISPVFLGDLDGDSEVDVILEGGSAGSGGASLYLSKQQKSKFWKPSSEYADQF